MKLPSKWRNVALAIGTVALVLATLVQIGPQQFGLRTTGYVLIGDHTMPPGLTVQVPFVQYTHKYKANTQSITLTAGGCRFWPTCNSTADQNPLRAVMVLQYRVVQNVEDLGFHEWAMEGFFFPDGYWLITDLLNTAANTALGHKTIADIQKSPDQFLAAVFGDFKDRVKLNNVPILIESLELREFNSWYTPIRMVAYGVKKS